MMIQQSDIIIPNHPKALAATLVRPAAHRKEQAAVLLMHGWVSQRHEVGDIYKNLALQLATQGITSLRFDFYGCGESSPEYLADLTIIGMLQDAKVALSYLQQTIKKNTPLGLCGFSLGSAVMSLLMHEHHQQTGQYLASVVGLSPIVNLISAFSYRHQNLIECMLMKLPADNESIEYDLGWRKISVRPEFIRQFTTLDPIIATSWQTHTNACLVIGGELDFSGENVKQFAHTAPNAKLLRQEFLPQTDHIFNIFSESDNHAPWAIETVTDWFVETLCMG